MKKILVTGASGLIGTELCKQLYAAGNIVYAVDNFSRSNIIPDCSTFVEIDLSRKDALWELDTDFDEIYHYSAINGTTNFYEFPNKVLSNNFISDVNVFEFAATCKDLRKLVYASSSEVMADSDDTTLVRGVAKDGLHSDIFINDIHNPRWSYRLAKIASENYLANSKLPWLIVRYFNVYGSNSKPGHFIGDQIQKMKRGEFSVIGGDETRSFCHVSDAVDATIFLANALESNELINVGNDREIYINYAVDVIAKEMGYADKTFKHIDGRAGSVKSRRPDLAKLYNYIPNYNPIRFEDAIRDIVKELK